MCRSDRRRAGWSAWPPGPAGLESAKRNAATVSLVPAPGHAGPVVTSRVVEEVAVDGGDDGRAEARPGPPARDAVEADGAVVGVVAAERRRVQLDVGVADRPGHLVDRLVAADAGVE